jgi:uncharacterized protein YwlG (UPF0340 family)
MLYMMHYTQILMNPVAVAIIEAEAGIEIGTMTEIEKGIGKWEEMQEKHSVQIMRVTARQK